MKVPLYAPCVLRKQISYALSATVKKVRATRSATTATTILILMTTNMECPFHPVPDYDPLQEYLAGGYLLSWKLQQGYKDEHGVFPDDVCDFLEHCKPGTRVFVEGQGWGIRPCDANLEHYEQIKHNKMALMVWLGVLTEIPRTAGQKDKEKIRESVLLHRVVEAYAPHIRSVGQHKYQARCPFHEDRLASMAVDDKKGLWYCHACGIGGDVFSFIMKAENCTFKEAVSRAEMYI